MYQNMIHGQVGSSQPDALGQHEPRHTFTRVKAQSLQKGPSLTCKLLSFSNAAMASCKLAGKDFSWGAAASAGSGKTCVGGGNTEASCRPVISHTMAAHHCQECRNSRSLHCVEADQHKKGSVCCRRCLISSGLLALQVCSCLKVFDT